MKKRDIFIFIFIFVVSWLIFDNFYLFSNIFIRWSIGAIPLLICIFYPLFVTFKEKENFSTIGLTFKNWPQGVLWGLGITLAIVILNKIFIQNHPLASFNNVGFGIVYWAFLSFSQEIFFRGYFQKNLEKAYGNLLGLIITSCFFALWHISIRFSPVWVIPSSLLKVFIAGLLWGLSFQKTKNLIAPCLSHFLIGVFFSVYR
ncbi:MAG: CPBP family intramembrane metalloprotease [Candidatus Pacebacteria bacterium]|nr:CPBP family intramembrane metalloprotease [Candidatus Paceibacterota bacterium]